MFTSDFFKQTQASAGEPRSSFVRDHTKVIIDKTLSQFRHITRAYVSFNIVFFLIGLIELLGLLLFFSFFAKSSLVAFSLGFIFLTGFSYFILRFYFQAKKPEQFFRLKEDFIAGCFKVISKEEEAIYLPLTELVYQLINRLEGQEYQYLASRYLKNLQQVLTKFSLWCHWQDVHMMKELLHFYCIKARVEWVKQRPTDPQAHVFLAHAHVALYKLYIDPRRLGKQMPYEFMAEQYLSPVMLEKFKKAAERAIEEFKILTVYMPENPWVHAQLALVYHDLELIDQEIVEYEILREMIPDDKELLFKLGVLYFQQGRNAQGLRLYEELQKTQDPQAADLIQFYEVK